MADVEESEVVEFENGFWEWSVEVVSAEVQAGQGCQVSDIGWDCAGKVSVREV